MRDTFGRGLLALAAMAACAGPAFATEHVVLRNGFDLLCDHRAALTDGHVRLFMAAEDGNFMDVDAADIVAVEAGPEAVAVKKAPAVAAKVPVESQPTAGEMREMMAKAGAAHDLDVDLLASVVRAESGGNFRAVSRTGAQGLMQLMPGTAAELGVKNSFRAEENINGGTTYLNALLERYHDNLALALAAYNAGPAAVDRYRGVPPYRETRAYVARVIHEFNRRKALAAAAERGRGAVAVADPQRQPGSQAEPASRAQRAAGMP